MRIREPKTTALVFASGKMVSPPQIPPMQNFLILPMPRTWVFRVLYVKHQFPPAYFADDAFNFLISHKLTYWEFHQNIALDIASWCAMQSRHYKDTIIRAWSLVFPRACCKGFCLKFVRKINVSWPLLKIGSEISWTQCRWSLVPKVKILHWQLLGRYSPLLMALVCRLLSLCS